jgi:hypothetical protein
MNDQEFNYFATNEIFNRINNVLTAKGEEYSQLNDRLKAFKDGAYLTGNCPEMTLWGFVTKHIISVKDLLVELDKKSKIFGLCMNDLNNSFKNLHPREKHLGGNQISEELYNLFMEKIIDIINYMILLSALLKEKATFSENPPTNKVHPKVTKPKNANNYPEPAIPTDD